MAPAESAGVARRRQRGRASSHCSLERRFVSRHPRCHPRLTGCRQHELRRHDPCCRRRPCPSSDAALNSQRVGPTGTVVGAGGQPVRSCLVTETGGSSGVRATRVLRFDHNTTCTLQQGACSLRPPRPVARARNGFIGHCRNRLAIGETGRPRSRGRSVRGSETPDGRPAWVQRDGATKPRCGTQKDTWCR